MLLPMYRARFDILISCQSAELYILCTLYFLLFHNIIALWLTVTAKNTIWRLDYFPMGHSCRADCVTQRNMLAMFIDKHNFECQIVIDGTNVEIISFTLLSLRQIIQMTPFLA